MKWSALQASDAICVHEMLMLVNVCVCVCVCVCVWNFLAQVSLVLHVRFLCAFSWFCIGASRLGIDVLAMQWPMRPRMTAHPRMGGIQALSLRSWREIPSMCQ